MADKAAMLTETWKRTPTTAGAVFGITLPYRPPPNSIGTVLWRKRLWFETTTGLSLLEPWEKILMLCIIYLMLTLVVTGLVKYAPQSFMMLQHRVAYYLFGYEPEKSVGHVVAGWAAHNMSGEL
ncbi:hypothetical protein AcW1_010134 [Taiwanofungus camphoratus]|nr:hypothetical protein AcV5_003029 [Antrodia cinnamomea]KAI0946765.1 hypothetical protein AcW1_010134 [Antrodia cinnamomea]